MKAGGWRLEAGGWSAPATFVPRLYRVCINTEHGARVPGCLPAADGYCLAPPGPKLFCLSGLALQATSARIMAPYWHWSLDENTQHWALPRSRNPLFLCRGSLIVAVVSRDATQYVVLLTGADK
jgi:hypothetical protein